MKKNDTAALWSALKPDARLQRQRDTHYLYLATRPDGTSIEIVIVDTRMLVILKARGWTFEKL
jgi:hypothetical protein